MEFCTWKWAHWFRGNRHYCQHFWVWSLVGNSCNEIRRFEYFSMNSIQISLTWVQVWSLLRFMIRETATAPMGWRFLSFSATQDIVFVRTDARLISMKVVNFFDASFTDHCWCLCTKYIKTHADFKPPSLWQYKQIKLGFLGREDIRLPGT